VGLAVQLRPEPEAPFTPATRPARIGETLPVTGRTDAELCEELQRVLRLESALAAYKAELIVALARKRPADLDVPVGGPGAASTTWGPGVVRHPETSEFFEDELALVLNCSRAAATAEAETSHVLLQRLPTTWAALADGQLDPPRARAIAAELGWPARDVDDRIVSRVEAVVLPRANELSIPRLKDLVRAQLLAHGAQLADRRRKDAEQLSHVGVQRERDGMSTLTAFLPTGRADACFDTIDQYARMAKADGDPRPLGLLRAMVFEDLVLRPWDTSRPPVTAQVNVTAPLSLLRPGPKSTDAPAPVGDVDGQPVTAAMLRELLTQLDAVCPGGLQAPAGGNLTISLVDPVSGRLRAVVTQDQLLRLVRRRCPAHAGSTCECSVIDRPPATDAYRPTSAQQVFIRTRDRTCRHPGCASRAGWADADHVIPHACGGPTTCENLCCLCRRHHRLKTHARGWLFAMTDTGVLTVTTPAGITRVTRPPGLAPPGQRAQTGVDPDDDPPPF
jgi:hypothetical protein